MSHNQTMNPSGRYQPDHCTVCGDWTPRRLPDRFPHICDDCLFNQHPDNEREPNTTHWSVMLAELHRAASRGKAPFFKPFGKNAET